MTSEENNIQSVNKVYDKNDRFTSRQWRLLITITFLNFCSAMCYSIQAPFYPNAANKKGVSSSVYGMIFGIFQFVIFIFCPIFGKYIRHIGPKFMLNAGSFVQGISCLLFGFIGKTSNTPFVVLSFILRIVEAIGQASSMTAAFAFIAAEFSNDLSTAFTIVETAFAVGIIAGPSFGGVLYEIGGFLLPFAVNGGALITAAILTAFFLLPEIENTRPQPLSIMKLLRIPSIAVSYYVIFTVAFGIGFLNVCLEPYLKSEFGVSTAIVGLFFTIPAGSYALTTFFWGTLADKYFNPMLITALGGALTCLGFFLMGPASLLLIKPTLWLIVVYLLVYGFGTGAQYIAPFIHSNKEAIRQGFPDDIETYGLISGLWASGLALGGFLGPIASGFLCDAIGFRNSTIIMCGQQVLVVLLSLIIYRRQKLTKNEESINLLHEIPNYKYILCQ